MYAPRALFYVTPKRFKIIFSPEHSYWLLWDISHMCMTTQQHILPKTTSTECPEKFKLKSTPTFLCWEKEQFTRGIAKMKTKNQVKILAGRTSLPTPSLLLDFICWHAAAQTNRCTDFQWWQLVKVLQCYLIWLWPDSKQTTVHTLSMMHPVLLRNMGTTENWEGSWVSPSAQTGFTNAITKVALTPSEVQNTVLLLILIQRHANKQILPSEEFQVQQLTCLQLCTWDLWHFFWLTWM